MYALVQHKAFLFSAAAPTPFFPAPFSQLHPWGTSARSCGHKAVFSPHPLCWAFELLGAWGCQGPTGRWWASCGTTNLTIFLAKKSKQALSAAFCFPVLLWLKCLLLLKEVLSSSVGPERVSHGRGERSRNKALCRSFLQHSLKRPKACFVPAAVISPHHCSLRRRGEDVKMWAELTDIHRGFFAAMLLTAFCLVSSILPPLLHQLVSIFFPHGVFLLSLLPHLNVTSCQLQSLCYLFQA